MSRDALFRALTLAYLEARRFKRWKTNTLQLSVRGERNLRALSKKIIDRCYFIKPSLCFVSFSPVKREIFAGDFQDRVVHHLVFQIINPFYNKLFINDCYSCRQERGTSYGIKRAAYFMRASSKNFKRPAYVLKLDISGYFMNIDQRKLYQKNKILIERFLKQDQATTNLLLYLIKKIIFNDPTKNCHLRGSLQDWQGLPKNKSLFFAAPGKGLPIGNLTSQLFGNVYLNDFDHFVKEKLKCRYYGRYVDDLFFCSHDKEFLKSLIPKIKKYLKNKLDLDLHPKKIYLQDCKHGVNFLGAFIRSGKIYAGKRIKRNFYQAINEALNNTESKVNFFNSYLGMLKDKHTYKLRRQIMTSSKTQALLKRAGLAVDKNFERVYSSGEIKELKSRSIKI